MANRLVESGEDRNSKYTDEEKRIMREFSMVEFMRLHGASIEHNGRMYSSPWRKDTNKSLEITDSKHLWQDFGDTDPSHMKKRSNGTMYAGGDTIDFVRVFMGFSSRGEAMDYLAGMMPGFIRSEGRDTAQRRLRGPLSGFTCHVSEPTTAWSGKLSEQGVWIEVHRSGEDKKGNPYMSAELLDEAAIHIDKANEALQRRPDKFMDTLSRYWAQVRDAESVFIIGRFAIGSETVLDGAAAWPAQMALDAGKPVYLYDMDRKQFYRCDEQSGWAWEHQTSVPAFTRSFAAVAPRASTPEMDAVIRVCIDKTARVQREGKAVMEKGKSQSSPVVAENVDILSDIASRPFSYGLNHFDNVVQFIQWSKAVWAGATEVAEAVLKAASAEEAWAAGGQLKSYDAAQWDAMFPDVRETALRVSFLSNPDAAQRLVDADASVVGKDVILARVREELVGNMVSASMEGAGERHYVIDDVRQGVSFRPNREYMEGKRNIARSLLSRYCADVKVHVESVNNGETVKGNPVIAVGFPNKSGGFELRKDSFVNASGETIPGMKKCTSKDITVISGDGRFLSDPLSPTTPSVLVFEGFVDFLAYLCWNGVETPKADCVILNSTSMVSSAVPFIASHGRVCAYLDNDDAGRKATEVLREAVKEVSEKEGRTVNFTDGSPAYADHKDISDAYSAYCGGQVQEQEQQIEV